MPQITNVEFNTRFYAAEGAYNFEEGGGELDTFGYTRVEAFIDPGTGAKAIIYKNEHEYLISFAGTENGAQDWGQNLMNMGWGQWVWLESRLNLFFEDKEATKIDFVGHSLGGALAQYAAYSFVSDGRISATAITLTTFNGLGGITALSDTGNVDDFNANILDGADEQSGTDHVLTRE